MDGKRFVGVSWLITLFSLMFLQTEKDQAGWEVASPAIRLPELSITGLTPSRLKRIQRNHFCVFGYFTANLT
jgi:hypothetical protein